MVVLEKVIKVRRKCCVGVAVDNNANNVQKLDDQRAENGTVLLGKADIELTGEEGTDLDGHLNNAKQLRAHQAFNRQDGTVV